MYVDNTVKTSKFWYFKPYSHWSWRAKFASIPVCKAKTADFPETLLPIYQTSRLSDPQKILY